MIDAEGERLGRLAAKIAGLLQGKHRPDYSRHQLSDDFVIVVNASKIGVSGNKLSQKLYHRHSGYLGSLRSRTLEEMLGRFPERVIELAVKGMLPRNRLGRRMLRRLKVYAGGAHPHEAQVRMGMGKPKQAPAAPSASRGRRRASEQPAPVAVADASDEAAAAVAGPVVEKEALPEQAAPDAVAAEATDEAAATVAEPVAEDEAPPEQPAPAVAEASEEAAATVAEPAAEEEAPPEQPAPDVAEEAEPESAEPGEGADRTTSRGRASNRPEDGDGEGE